MLYISWNNGFTAILTKFSGHQTGRYFMRSIKSQMVFYFGPWFRFLHVSREIMVVRRILLNILPFKKGKVLYEKNQIPNGFRYRSIILFFAYISWNNGITAILTKFLPYKKGEVFYEKNQFPNVFRFRNIISFFAYISWNNGFTAILTKFSCHQRGGILWEESLPNWFSISKHNFHFCIYLVK